MVLDTAALHDGESVFVKFHIAAIFFHLTIAAVKVDFVLPFVLVTASTAIRVEFYVAAIRFHDDRLSIRCVVSMQIGFFRNVIAVDTAINVSPTVFTAGCALYQFHRLNHVVAVARMGRVGCTATRTFVHFRNRLAAAFPFFVSVYQYVVVGVFTHEFARYRVVPEVEGRLVVVIFFNRFKVQFVMNNRTVFRCPYGVVFSAVVTIQRIFRPVAARSVKHPGEVFTIIIYFFVRIRRVVSIAGNITVHNDVLVIFNAVQDVFAKVLAFFCIVHVGQGVRGRFHKEDVRTVRVHNVFRTPTGNRLTGRQGEFVEQCFQLACQIAEGRFVAFVEGNRTVQLNHYAVRSFDHDTADFAVTATHHTAEVFQLDIKLDGHRRRFA